MKYLASAIIATAVLGFTAFLIRYTDSLWALIALGLLFFYKADE